MPKSSICSIPNCGKKLCADGWCGFHYIENVVLGYEGDACLIWPGYRDKNGYARVNDHKEDRLAYRIVCRKTHGEPPTPKHETAHNCGRGNLGCVAKKHLRWATRSENQQDRVAHGTHLRGTRQPTAKLTEADVLAIRALKNVETVRVIAARFQVVHSSVVAIQNRKSWAWLPDQGVPRD